MSERPTIYEIARKLVDTLEAEGIDYAIGGALAYGYWAPPRGTTDVDITLFLEPAGWRRGVEAIRKAGCEVDTEKALEQARQRGDFRASCAGYRIDVYFPSFELYDRARSRKVSRPLGGRPAWFWTGEDLATFKMLFLRGKDLVDVERMLAFRPEFDRGYVRDWLVRLMGEDDERLRKWDELTSRIPPSPPRRAGD